MLVFWKNQTATDTWAMPIPTTAASSTNSPTNCLHYLPYRYLHYRYLHYYYRHYQLTTFFLTNMVFFFVAIFNL